MVTPEVIIDYNMARNATHVVKEQVIPGYNPDLYSNERLFASLANGVKVPISIVYRKDLFKQDGTNPMLLVRFLYIL